LAAHGDFGESVQIVLSGTRNSDISALAAMQESRAFSGKIKISAPGKTIPRVFSALIPSEGQQIKTGIPTDKTGYNLIRKHKTLQESASAEKTGFSRFFYKFISDNL